MNNIRNFVKIMAHMPDENDRNWRDVAIPLEDIIEVSVADYSETENIVTVIRKDGFIFSEIVDMDCDCPVKWLNKNLFQVGVRYE